MFKVTWIFRNEHEWTNTFDSANERELFINRCGLVTHPDIVRVFVMDPEGAERDILRVG